MMTDSPLGPPPLEPNPAAKRNSVMQILIADDSATSRRVLEATLQNWGYEVVAVEDGSAAWEILKKDRSPQLAILDWVMPGFSGPEVCRLVRGLARPRYTYILLLTSKNQKADIIEGMEAGADDYVVKPFDSNELKVRLGPGRRILELQGELLETQAALHEQATRDALTHLWNRRAILEILNRELARSLREESPLGIVLGDVDRFKSINDEFGHIVGDTVLRKVGVQMAASVRHYDAVGRYGGEEFLIVLPGCDLEASQRLAERVRVATEQIPESVLGIDRNVTMSFGLTAQIPHSGTNLELLLKTADEALYQAKEQGRNRVVARLISNPGTAG